MKNLAHAAGQSAAASAFGLHGTPRPPAPWSKKWHDSGRAITIPSMHEKKAFVDPITATLGLIGTHIAPNLAGKAMRRFAPGVGERNFAAGLEHGLSGKKLNPALEGSMTGIIGPESLINYRGGMELADRVKHLPPAQQKAQLQAYARAVAENKPLAGAPVIGSGGRGIERYLKGERGVLAKMPTVDASAPTKLRQRVIPWLAQGALAATSPHTVPHMVLNHLRERIAKTDFGKNLMKKNFVAGAKGEAVSPLRRAVMTTAVSPAYYDTRDMGLAANKMYSSVADKANTAFKNHGLKAQMPQAATLADFGEKVWDRAHAMQQPTPTTPKGGPPRFGGIGPMGTALGLGGLAYVLANRSRPDEENLRR